ncbi:MAG: VanZ family protein [Bacteroidia bacterium]|nr:VanZ family protein [Bacteroidia bacterium]
MEALFKRRFLIVWGIFVLVLSTMPASEVPKIDFPHLDKIVHVGLYMVLSCLICGYLFRKLEWSKLKLSIISLILAGIYGLLMELIQFAFFKSRSFEVSDIISNIIGSFIGIILVNKFFNSKK